MITRLTAEFHAGLPKGHGGAEIDLLLFLPDGRRWAVEIKHSMNPRPSRGFHAACEDIKPSESFVVYPGTERIPLGENLEGIGLLELAGQLYRYREDGEVRQL